MAFVDDFDSIVRSPCMKGRTPANANVVALCFHDEEYPELNTSAEDVARFFQNPARQASTTGVIDNDSKVGCVDYDNTAWHTGAGDPWNFMIEGYEHSGYARQTADEWLDEYGMNMLDRSAAHFAKRCNELGIPIRKIGPDQLRIAIQSNDPSQGGIIGHHDITLAVPVYGGHTDPGQNFPWDYYINLCQAHSDGSAQPPTPVVPNPVVTTTNSPENPAWVGFSEQTKVVQNYLTEIGIDPGPVDGIYGTRTENAVIDFQQRALDTDGNRLVVDGICGPKTFASLCVCVYLKRTNDTTAPAPVLAELPTLPYPVQYGFKNDTVVKRVQQRLRARGWDIEVDADFGDQTNGIVRQFQQEKGLTVDGVVGPLTWGELFRTDNIT